MTDASLPPPVPPQPSPRPRNGWGGWIAWMVILATVGSILFTHIRAASHDAAVPAVSAASRNIAFEIVGRYAVGFKALLSVLGSAPQPSAIQSLAAQVREAAQSPIDQVRAVPVLAELTGADDALAQLRSLQGQALPGPLREDVEALEILYTRGPGALDPAQRARLLERHGWFARLALSFSQLPSDPNRQSTLAPAIRTAVTLLLAIPAGLAALGGGLVLFIIAITRLARGRLRRAYVPAPQANSAYLEGFAIYLGGMFLFSWLIRATVAQPTLSSTWLLAPIVAAAALWPRLRGASPQSLRQALGWYRGRGLAREAFAGLVGYLAILPLLGAGLLVTVILSRYAGTPPTHPIVFDVPGGFWQIMRLYLLACLWAPIVEESMFRGLFFHHLRRRWRWAVSAVTVGLIFAAVHPQGWAAIPVLAAVGIGLAALREWRGSTLAPMAAHALHNGLALTFLVLMLE